MASFFSGSLGFAVVFVLKLRSNLKLLRNLGTNTTLIPKEPLFLDGEGEDFRVIPFLPIKYDCKDDLHRYTNVNINTILTCLRRMKMKKILAMVPFLVLVFLSGCTASQSPIQINSPWIRSAASGGNTAAFMVIKNSAAQEDKLVKAEATVSGTVVLMNTEMKDGKMQMADTESITVPANAQVELKSGGFHVMFMGLTKDLNDGDTVQLTLTFEKGGTINLNVPVKKPAAQ